MTQVIVLSDVHGRYDLLLKAVRRHEKTAARFLFCGDGYPQIQRLLENHSDLPFSCVRGNCDYGDCPWPWEDTITVDETTIFFTHGHRYDVGLGTGALEKAARNAGARVVCFGHTHVRMEQYHDGVYLFNPGSVGRSRLGKNSYGILDLHPTGVLMQVCDL